MAIKDTTKKPYIEDRDGNIFIGLDMPLRKSEGREGNWKSTETTIEAVKNNIRNLINTHRGERLMQPLFGMNLRNYLFQSFDEDVVVAIQNEIVDTFKKWLPFVLVRDIRVTSADNSTIEIKVIFSIQNDPNTLESIDVQITGE